MRLADPDPQNHQASRHRKGMSTETLQLHRPIRGSSARTCRRCGRFLIAHAPLPRWRLQRAICHLRRGGILAYPTEGVYGLGCDPRNAEAVERILVLKDRPATKGLILIAAAFEQLLPFIQIPPEDILGRISATWPGPVTWVLPASSRAPSWLRGRHTTVACRVTDHPIATALCWAFGGALISTSANPTGRLPARSPLQVRRYFGHDPSILLIPGPLGKLEGPTPIFDALSGRCLRA